MSHKATAWLSDVRGLKPGEFVVLFHLCDCHNPKKGCFPSQQYLLDAAGVSNGSLNNHLNSLEQKGLVRREKRFEEGTFRQKSTRYMLKFEDDFSQDIEGPSPEIGDGISAKAVSKKGQKPSPKNSESRLQNLETNHVKEPVKEPVRRAEAREPLPDVRDQFENSVWPYHWREGDSSKRAFEEFEKLSVEERAECCRVMEVAKSQICKAQPNAGYRPGLARWIREKRFVGLADAARALEKQKAQMEGAETIDRFADAELFKACEVARGKQVPSALNRYMFEKRILDKARASL